MDYIFESERLGFRNWTEADCIPFSELNADPVVMEFFPNPLKIKETRSMLGRLGSLFNEDGFTFYAVDLLETGRFIGFIGIIRSTFEASFTPCIEIGWRLRKEYWNKGYATEGAKACLNYAFDTFQFNEIYAITAVLNKKSEGIMKKIGMTYYGQFDHPKLAFDDRLRPHVIYRIKRENE